MARSKLQKRGAPRAGVNWTSDTLTPTLAQFTVKANVAIAASSRLLAAEIERWMKEHAPWENRTGEARRTLKTYVDHVGGFRTEIILAHGVAHGYWLEVIQNGRYSIIVPTLEHFEGAGTWAFYGPMMGAATRRRLSG